MYGGLDATEEDWELEHYGIDGCDVSESEGTDDEEALYRHIHYNQEDGNDIIRTDDACTYHYPAVPAECCTTGLANSSQSCGLEGQKLNCDVSTNDASKKKTSSRLHASEGTSTGVNASLRNKTNPPNVSLRSAKQERIRSNSPSSLVDVNVLEDIDGIYVILDDDEEDVGNDEEEDVGNDDDVTDVTGKCFKRTEKQMKTVTEWQVTRMTTKEMSTVKEQGLRKGTGQDHVKDSCTSNSGKTCIAEKSCSIKKGSQNRKKHSSEANDVLETSKSGKFSGESIATSRTVKINRNSLLSRGNKTNDRPVRSSLTKSTANGLDDVIILEASVDKSTNAPATKAKRKFSARGKDYSASTQSKSAFFIDSMGMDLENIRREKKDSEWAWKQERKKSKLMIREGKNSDKKEHGTEAILGNSDECMLIESCSEEEGMNVHFVTGKSTSDGAAEKRSSEFQHLSGSTCISTTTALDGRNKRGIPHKLRGRYFVQSQQRHIKCRNCFEMGHIKADCPRPPHVPACILCGVRGHTDKMCPVALCFNCSLPGHQLRSCPGKRNMKYAKCNRCQMTGHVRKMCPDLWRQYHLTTKYGPLVKPTMKQRMTNRSDVYCCNCSQKGHKYYDCHSARMDEFVLFTYDDVCCYDYKTTVKRKRHREQQEDDNSRPTKKWKASTDAGSFSRQPTPHQSNTRKTFSEDDSNDGCGVAEAAHTTKKHLLSDSRVRQKRHKIRKKEMAKRKTFDERNSQIFLEVDDSDGGEASLITENHLQSDRHKAEKRSKQRKEKTAREKCDRLFVNNEINSRSISQSALALSTAIKGVHHTRDDRGFLLSKELYPLVGPAFAKRGQFDDSKPTTSLYSGEDFQRNHSADVGEFCTDSIASERHVRTSGKVNLKSRARQEKNKHQLTVTLTNVNTSTKCGDNGNKCKKIQQLKQKRSNSIKKNSVCVDNVSNYQHKLKNQFTFMDRGKKGRKWEKKRERLNCMVQELSKVELSGGRYVPQILWANQVKGGGYRAMTVNELKAELVKAGVPW